MAFKIDLSDLIAKQAKINKMVEAKAVELAAKVTVDVHAAVVLGSPVDTGKFRGAWTIPLTYKDDHGTTVTLTEGQKVVENQPNEDQDETKPWVRWTITPGASQQTATGPALFTSLGTATLQVFVPKGKGAGQAIDLKTAFENGFRNWKSGDKCLKVYKLDSSKGADKDYLQVNVAVFYESKRLA
jgi:hypothetical protein